MKRIIASKIILVLALFGLIACNDTGNANRTNTNVNIVNGNLIGVNSLPNTNTANVNAANTMGMNLGSNPTDAQGFATRAAQGGMAEVELGRLASQKAQNAEVKKFGQMMVQDHTNANTELKSLAGKKNITLPTALDAEHKAVMDKLQGLSGAEFDKAYMDAMVEDHEKTIDLFQAQADDGDDADMKAFASKTLPKLKQHLEMAESINGKLK